MWRMSSPLQKTANFSLVNCGLLSLTRTSMLPNRPHTSLITLIVAALVMAAGILKISGHFENVYHDEEHVLVDWTGKVDVDPVPC